MGIKIGTDGSGVTNIIYGCPHCENDGTKNIRYLSSNWYFDPNMDNGRYSFKIKFCPMCGKKLPFLTSWNVVSDV